MLRNSFWSSYSFTTFPLHRASGVVAFFSVVVILALVELVLKGFALWRAARLKQPLWFVVILVINSVGILPLLYLLFTKPEGE